MEETKDSNTPPPDRVADTFKQHCAGTFVARGQMPQGDPIDHTTDTKEAKYKPDDPLERIVTLWRFIKDPNHSGAVIAILTVVIALSNVGYDIVASYQMKTMKGQLNQMKRQSVIMQDQLEMADRPWIKDSVRSAFDFTWDRGAISWSITIRAENVGHSVATAILPEARLIAVRGADFVDLPRQKAKELCDSVSERFGTVKNDPAVLGNAVFPSDSLEFVSNPVLWPSEINSATFDGGAHLGKSITPMLIGCIEYHYAASERIHKTWFVYTLAHSDDPELLMPTRAFFSVGKTIPSANLVLFKADQFAD
jgi:hypothetical protein